MFRICPPPDWVGGVGGGREGGSTTVEELGNVDSPKIFFSISSSLSERNGAQKIKEKRNAQAFFQALTATPRPDISVATAILQSLHME